jgi:hypothetical protein
MSGKIKWAEGFDQVSLVLLVDPYEHPELIPQAYGLAVTTAAGHKLAKTAVWEREDRSMYQDDEDFNKQTAELVEATRPALVKNEE